MGIINLAGESGILNEITQHRPLASVPFGSRYRLIDFVLSSMVNSGIENVGIITSHPHRSLVDHLRSATDWQLSSNKDGLVLLPPPYSAEVNIENGDLLSFSGNMDFFNKSRQEYVIVAGAGVVSSINYQDALKFHEEISADITFLYKKEDKNLQDCSNCMVADLNGNRVTAIHFNPSTIDNPNFLLDTFILKKNKLIELIADSKSKTDGTSLIKIIADNLSSLKGFAYHYSGYAARIHCISSYYNHSLSLLEPRIWQQLFSKPERIYTKVRDEAPTRYFDHAKVANVLLAGGCSVAGQVERSILFRRVVINRGAQVKGSILMSNTRIGEGAILENVICDKDVIIGAGQCLRGQETKPLVIRKGTVIEND